MYSNDRKQMILKLVRENGTLSTNQLIEKIPASPATIRRDLVELDKMGAVERKRGFVCHKDSSGDFIMFDMRKSINDEEKNEIGKLAATLISDGDTVIIDASSTGLAIARNLINRKNITVITNSIQIAFLLSNSEVPVFVSSGLVYDFAIVGSEAEGYFSERRVDIAFIGSTGVRRQEGLTSVSPLHAAIRKHMVKAATKVYAVLDSSKFERTGVELSVKFSELTGIVTSEKIKNEEVLNELNRLGVELHYTCEQPSTP